MNETLRFVRSKFNNYVYPENKLVISWGQMILGMETDEGSIRELTDDQIKWCEKHGLRYSGDTHKRMFLDHIKAVGKEIVAAKINVQHKSLSLYKNYTKDDYQDFLIDLRYQEQRDGNYIWFKDGSISLIFSFRWQHLYIPPIPNYDSELHKWIIKLKTFSNGRLYPYELLETIELKSFSKRYRSKYLLDSLKS